jgi:hypothetical protein
VTVPSTTFAYTLTGLQPQTTYCGWVSASNGIGTIGSWPWYSFTTPAS